ncbi:peptidoglycan-binding domain-containing protein [Okeania sp.]|uniref:peptidoglycan-binding domain-containing protein n=1 Tax=Okeania sp. TaxID=3100323 RepID=UPI002B4B2FC8|nr:peptidoglycan-binding domain-containing protein [Okeania sp.]MEB3340085.1 peptidoglycan-binding domain-containing protein [Okeania sp.]
MMRVPTITTLLSVAALFNLNFDRAIASNKTESLTKEEEENLISQLKSKNFTLSETDRIKTKFSEKPKNQNFLIPLIPGNSRFSEQPTQTKLFSKPFYSGVPQKQTNQKNISEGDRGAEVWAVQRRLQARGFDPGTIDSVFGARTTKTVKDFQESAGLTVTGIVDEITWTSLAKPSLVSRSPLERETPSIVSRSPIQEKSPIVSPPPFKEELPIAPALPIQRETPPIVSQPSPEIAKATTPKQNQVVETDKILAKGDRGSKVKTLQLRLETMGFNPGPIDGIFGMKTVAAVKEFQKSQGIEIDGIVNEKTWEAFSNN